jgi:hypothetical protein
MCFTWGLAPARGVSGPGAGGKSDRRNLPGFPIHKTVVSDTVHRETGAGPDRAIDAPR